MAASRLGLARLPKGITAIQVWGAAALCGIGFTMSLFITELSFHEGPNNKVATLAVFIASLASALCGLLILGLARQPKRAG
jgi:NhaA family Na+:H+ antiporter